MEDGEIIVDAVDTDGDDAISAAELLAGCESNAVLSALGCPEDEDEAQDFIDEYDTNGDGLLSAQEIQAAANANDIDGDILDVTDNAMKYGLIVVTSVVGIVCGAI